MKIAARTLSKQTGLAGRKSKNKRSNSQEEKTHENTFTQEEYRVVFDQEKQISELAFVQA